ncbi:nuclear transport factor 2 family protein [Litoreibacter roseus]|uniref:SnoaL-like polyketide cyclase n=1 Tax=Litoreibacter roseus TaxID=2601869 RepID=A0A6N6JIY9_9RHOB|nr:ester cyclase [Litoreibacter roseus]GFE65248.1 hypothetical protein KIN_23220 [Litoreibacter roseus]
MKNFDPKWTDPAHYILGITKAIWEDRGIDTLHTYYGDDLIVRSPASIVKGNDGIIAATLATLAEFPDRALFGEDVIWCDASDHANGGFLSSHRLICTATHTQQGIYGPPTGRALTYRIIADCFCADNQVKDEWLVRDQSAIVQQMGFDVIDWTRDLIRREGGPEHCVQPFSPALNIEGPYQGRGTDDPWGQTLADVLYRIMSAEFSTIPGRYDRAAALAYPGHKTGTGPRDADGFWLGLRASFPSAKFEIHHIIGAQDPQTSPRAAVRWSLDGVHDGWGHFGRPTGANVHVMGITHAEFGPYGHEDGTVRREWTLFDETAIWKQILLQTGDI